MSEIEIFYHKFNKLTDEHEKFDNIEDLEDLKIKLKNNQKTAIFYCKVLEKNEGFKIFINEDVQHIKTSIGVIGCKVGSGKSFVVLSLIISQPLLYFNREICEFNNSFTYSTVNKNTYTKTLNSNIILAPHKIIKQWENYINNFTKIKNLVTISTKKDLKELENLIENSVNLEDYIKTFLDNSLFLVSSTRWNDFANFFNGLFCEYIFSRIFIDEVQEINVPNSQKIRSNFIWFITSSINDMYYTKNTGFISNTIIRVSNYSDYLIIKTDNKYVEECQNLPEPLYKKIICKSHRLLKIIGNVITQDIKNMLEAEDIDGVVSTLGLTVVSEKNIIDKICIDLVRELNNYKLEHEYKKKRTFSSIKSKEDSINMTEKKINEIENKIKNIEDRIKESDLDPITRCDIENPVLVNCCNNKYDLDSLLSLFSYNESKSIKTTCPLCRSIISSKNLLFLSEKNNIENKKNDEGNEKIKNSFVTREKTKLENLAYLLKNIDKEKRVLIFSDYEGNFSTISDIFNKNKDQEIKQIKGSGVSINNLIEKYKKKEIKNLFLNAKHNASGLNLQMTDIIIIMHKMSKEKEKQVIGRAQRIGRDTALEIYHFLSIDE